MTALTMPAIRTATNSGKSRDRAAAINATEGQVDVMVSKITAAVTAAPTAPSWPWIPLTGTITDSGPDPTSTTSTTSTTTTVTYYEANDVNPGFPAAGTVVRQRRFAAPRPANPAQHAAGPGA
jgi:hypothetical protein